MYLIGSFRITMHYDVNARKFNIILKWTTARWTVEKIGGEDSNNNLRFDSFITECNCGKFCKWTSGKPFCYDPNEYDYSVYHYDSDYDHTYESEIATIPETPVLLPDAVDNFLTGRSHLGWVSNWWLFAGGFNQSNHVNRKKLNN